MVVCLCSGVHQGIDRSLVEGVYCGRDLKAIWVMNKVNSFVWSKESDLEIEFTILEIGGLDQIGSQKYGEMIAIA